MNLGCLFADIFIVESDADLVRSMRVLLQSAGYTVRSAGSGEEAKKIIQASPPDLILLSCSLSDVNSHDMARHLKNNTDLPFIPIIVMGHPDDSEDVTVLDAGADEFINKPIDNTELLTRVRAMLRLKITTDDLAELNATLEQKVEQRTRELEEAHAKLRHNEKLSALGRLAASVAHEVNNPLGSILAHLYLVQEMNSLDPSVRHDLSVIERQVDRIASLVDQLRTFSKPPREERRPVVLTKVVEDVLTLTSRELEKRNIKIVSELDDTLPPVLASPGQLEEVFMNLILNSRDAMPEGGTLKLCANVLSDEECVEAQVIDTGLGIPSDVKDRIFEPFFTTKGDEGTGLGLAISHSIIEDHGGVIEVESQVGQGTKFTLQLPMAA